MVIYLHLIEYYYSCLTDLTYITPGDDVNKDAVIELLVLDSDELDDDDDDDVLNESVDEQ